LIIITMPDISTFEWWEYITHNSVIWIWMKTGVGGFVALLYLVGSTVLMGGRALWRMPGGNLSAITTVALLYIVMHFIYAYVDMSWDIQSMLFVGSMMGVINSVESIAARPEALPGRRWPWQPRPRPAPGLKPI
jgi:O-antigen ligase